MKHDLSVLVLRRKNVIKSLEELSKKQYDELRLKATLKELDERIAEFRNNRKSQEWQEEQNRSRRLGRFLSKWMQEDKGFAERVIKRARPHKWPLQDRLWFRSFSSEEKEKAKISDSSFAHDIIAAYAARAEGA